MRFFVLSCKMGKQFIDGNYGCWPDMVTLFLSPAVPAELTLRILQGSELPDLICGGWHVYSQRFLDVLAACQATGYTSFPMRVVRGDLEIPGYFGVKILGRGGPLDAERSGVVWLPGGTAKAGLKAVYMKEEEWDGSDIFAIPGCGITMHVTERVAEAIRKARLTNIALIPNSEACWGVCVPRSTWDYPRRRRKRKKTE